MEMSKNEIQCPYCKGSSKANITTGINKGLEIECWHCRGTGKISKVNQVRDLLFEAMITDSTSLRQKLLWTEVAPDLEEAGNIQIKLFEESIQDAKEEAFIIEEYKEHLKKFKEWFQIFLMDLKIIVMFRNGSESFQKDEAVDEENWIIKG